MKAPTQVTFVRPDQSPENIVAETSSTAQPQTHVRYHGLDALRGFAMMLGIVLHAALSYFLAESGYGVFWPQDNQQSPLSQYIFDFIHSWRMPTFFILAGFFAHLVLERRSTKHFFRDRIKRILLPFIIFGIVMATILPTIWDLGIERTFKFTNPIDIPLGDQTIGHLWFIYHLIYLYAILLAARWIASKIKKPIPLGRVLLWTFVNRWQAPFIILIAFVITALYTVGNEDKKLWPIDPFDFIYSLTPFLFGYGLYKRRQLVNQLASNQLLIPTLIVATVSFIAQEWLQQIVGDDDALGLLLILAIATSTVCYSLGLIGLFQRIFTTQSDKIRWIADSSYWVYIMHLPVVLLVAYSLFELNWPAELKFIIVCVITAGLGFLTYWIFIRYTIIGTMLNGKRIRGKVGNISPPPSNNTPEHMEPVTQPTS